MTLEGAERTENKQRINMAHGTKKKKRVNGCNGKYYVQQSDFGICNIV